MLVDVAVDLDDLDVVTDAGLDGVEHCLVHLAVAERLAVVVPGR